MYKRLIVGMVVIVFLLSAFPVVAGPSEKEERTPDAYIVYETGSFEISKKPSDPGGGKNPPQQPSEVTPWGIDRIDADLVTSTGSAVKIAILDTGIDSNHPDLAANIKGGINYIKKGKHVNPNNWEDDNGHGTHVAGIIGAIDNEIGVIGVAPEAWLYAVKVLNSNGNGYIDDIVAGINWAITNGMDVISMSLRTTADFQAFHDACDTAYAAGIVIVAASGNDGSTVAYPAKYDSVIAVSATDISDNVPSWSNVGEEIELSAPGVNIYSTWKGDGYNTISGTSMACPHVSGTAALVLNSEIGSYDIDNDGVWDPAEVLAKLTTTAEYLGDSNLYGSGLVDAQAACGL